MSGARTVRTGLALVLLAASAGAASKNAGTSGAAFLKIGAGARPAGMGEAYTALADDVHSVAWNPAGLGRMKTAQFTAMRAQWLQEADYSFAAAAHPLGGGVAGVGFTSLSVDGIEKRAGDTDAPDGTFSSDDAAYSLSYGRPFGRAWTAGATLAYLRQTLDGRSAAAFSGALGLQWTTPHEPLGLGFSVRNIGTALKFDEESDPQPLTVTVGTGYRLMQDRLRLGLDVRQSGGDVPFGAGLEYIQPFSTGLSGALRAGYNNAAADVQDASGASLGMGLSWQDWSFDMAWSPYGVLGNAFRYAFLVKF